MFKTSFSKILFYFTSIILFFSACYVAWRVFNDGILKTYNAKEQFMIGILPDERATSTELNAKKVSGLLPNNINTADWKTYRSEKFSFEIKYPSDLGREIMYEGFDRTAGYWRSYIHFNLPKLGEHLYPYYSFEASGPLVDCHLTQSQTAETRKQIFEIDGVPFTRYEYAHPTEGRIYTVLYYGEHQDACYRFTYSQANKLKENITRFEQIVSTFSLLDSE